MPWNYPYYQVARFAAPNLVLGNTILLKHAGSCPQSALAIEQIFKDAGLPDGAYTNLFLSNEQVAEVIADDPSPGRFADRQRAGRFRRGRGGRPEPEEVRPGTWRQRPVHRARFRRPGRHRQGRPSAAGWATPGRPAPASKRFIVVEDLYDAFVEKFTARMARIKPGDPLQADTTFGPLSSQSAADGLIEQIQDAVDKGATLRTGGHHVDGPGAFVEPTVLTDVTPDMRAFSEELFGPAAVIYKVANAAEAIELANGSPYGLGGSVFSADVAKAQEVADQLDTGMVFINSVAQTQADLPFGGVKRSGVGRELGRFGMDEFVNKKLIRTPR